MGESKEDSKLVVEGKKMVPRCPFQVASKMRPYTPLSKQRSNEFLKYVMEREKMKET